MYYVNGVMVVVLINFDNRDDYYNMGIIRLEEDLVGYRSLMYMDGIRLLLVSFNVGVVGLFQSMLQVNGVIFMLRNLIFSFIVFDVLEFFCENCRILYFLGLQFFKYEVCVFYVGKMFWNYQLIIEFSVFVCFDYCFEFVFCLEMIWKSLFFFVVVDLLFQL